MTTYTIYNNGKAIFTTQSWNTALEIAARETTYTGGNIWIEDSNGKIYN